MPDRAQDTEAIRAARERLRRACEDGERLYRKRMHAEPTIADDNRIDGILTYGLSDALGAYDRLVARLEAAERVVAEAERFLDLDLGYLSEPTREALQPLIRALAAAAPDETTRGGLIHTPTKRVMGVDAPDLGDPIGGAAPGETTEPQP